MEKFAHICVVDQGEAVRVELREGVKSSHVIFYPTDGEGSDQLRRDSALRLADFIEQELCPLLGVELLNE